MGNGVSRSTHDEVLTQVAEKDAEIHHLQTEVTTRKTSEQNLSENLKSSEQRIRREEADNHKHKQEIQSVQSANSKLSADLQELQSQHNSLTVEHEVTKANLFAVVSMLNNLGPQPDGEDTIIPRLTSAGVGVEELQDDVRAAMRGIHERMCDMQRQVNGYKRKVAAMKEKEKEQVEVILQQKKKILVVENKNEKLKAEDPVRRMETMKRRLSLTSTQPVA